MKKLTLLFTLLIFLAGPVARPAELTDLITETQKLVHAPGRLILVWWIPTEYWSLALKNDPRITDAQRTDINTMLSKYTVFVVVAADIGPMAAMQVKPRAEIVANTEFQVGGKVVPLLPPEEVSKSATNLISVMKPLMASMLGTLGQGMEFLLYANEKNGTPLIEATKTGEFTYTAFGNKLTWRLPLGSLMPPKMDPTTKEEFPGNYLFNPFTGGKLVLKDTPAQK